MIPRDRGDVRAPGLRAARRRARCWSCSSRPAATSRTRSSSRPSRSAPIELQQAANYLNSEFKGRSLSDVRQAVLDRLREEQTLYDELMARALRLASTTFEGLERQPSIYIQGTALLFEVTAGHDPEIDARDDASRWCR